MNKNLEVKLGFSLVEVILTIALFAIFATGLMGLIFTSYGSDFQAEERDKATNYAQEGLDAAWSIRRQAWNLLTNGDHGLNNSSGYWELTDTEDLLENKYTRVITIENFCRDSGGSIVDCGAGGAIIDLNSKKITSDVSYTSINKADTNVALVSYLTTWQTEDWVQTNWLGSSGQVIWADPTKYQIDDGNIDSSVAGQIKLSANGGAGSWSASGGEEISDTTDAEFNQGTFDKTITTGSGILGRLELTQSLLWAIHPQSEVAVSQSLNGIDFVSANDVWGVGDSGKIIRYDGSSWIEFVDLGSQNIFAIDIITASDGWAVGANGFFYKYNGTTWSEFIDTGNTRWFSLSMINSSDGWASGNSGRLAHYDGATWATVFDQGNISFNSIDMVSATDGWVVGNGGQIYRYNGVSWTEFVNTGGQTWNGLDMVSATNGWVVGNGGQIYRYDGVSWNSVSSPTTQDLTTIHMLSATDGWAAGDSGILLRYNGIDWSIVTSLITDDIFTIKMTSAGTGWAMGWQGLILEYGTLYNQTGTFLSRILDSGDVTSAWHTAYWTEDLPTDADITISTRTGNTPSPGPTWSVFSSELTDSSLSSLSSPNGRYLQYRATFTRGINSKQTPKFFDVTFIYNPATGENINDMIMIDSSNSWAVGNGGKILLYNGLGWTEFTDTGNTDWQGIFALSPSDIWTVGTSGDIRRYMGVSWDSVTSPVTNNLNSVFLLTASDGWAVGASGKILKYDGVNWVEFVDTGNTTWNDLFMVTDSDGWIVGSGGVIYGYNGVNWSSVVTPVNNNLNGLDMLSASDGWAVGDSGKILRYNGVSWLENTDVGNANLNEVRMVATNDVWVVGDTGQIYHYNGSSWGLISSPVSTNLNSIDLLTDVDGWIVGGGGTILKFKEGDPGFAFDGNFTSSAFNTGASSSFNILSWQESIPSCSSTCSIKLQVRTAPDAGGVPGTWSAWFGASGSGGYFTNANGTLIPINLNFNQWVQYRAEFIGDSIDTPILEEVKLNYLP